MLASRFFQASALGLAVMILSLVPGAAADPCELYECPPAECGVGFEEVTPPGRCCPVCQAPPTGPPTNTASNRPCAVERCPQFFCAEGLQPITPRGQCCAICQDQDVCTVDECPRCDVRLCPKLFCAEGSMPYTPDDLSSPSGDFGLQGACCPICRPVPTPTLTPCDEVPCPVSGCEVGFEMVTPDGQCCPICQLVCRDIACAAVECEAGFEMVTPDDQCCPSCQPPPTGSPTLTTLTITFVNPPPSPPSNLPCAVTLCFSLFCSEGLQPSTPPGMCCPICQAPCPSDVCPDCTVETCRVTSCDEGFELHTLDGPDGSPSGQFGYQGGCCPSCRPVCDDVSCTDIECGEGFEKVTPDDKCCPICRPLSESCSGGWCAPIDARVCVSRDDNRTSTYANPCKALDCGASEDDWISLAACPPIGCGAGFEALTLDGDCCPTCQPCDDAELCNDGEDLNCSPGFSRTIVDGECCPTCRADPTSTPTPAPAAPSTSKPTPSVLPAPGTSKPTPSVPTPAPTPAPSMAPTIMPTWIAITYCPEGYTDLGDRWNRGLGRITIVQSHQECADRCHRYAGVEFDGGCKGYMTGHYYHMLMCRSYGGGRRTIPCAPWATPEHKGIESGLDNVGGNCCTRIPSLNEDAD